MTANRSYFYPDLPVAMSDVKLREGLRSIAIIPILFENRVIACLNVASFNILEVSANARNSLEAIAAQVGSAFVRIKAEEALRRERDLISRLMETSPAGIVWVNREYHFCQPSIREGLRADKDKYTTHYAPW
jgi:GAF domain-containing protein